MFPFDHAKDDRQDFVPASSSSSMLPDKLCNQGFWSRGGVTLATDGTEDRQRECPFGNKEDEVVKVRKIMHREIERQRRQEMANLCGSLRTLLPLEYIKGKRSMSDNMQEAVNYIKDMQNNIHRLKAKRGRLLNKFAVADNNNRDDSSSSVTVNPCLNGVEILINGSHEDGQGFPLSRILGQLLGTGLGNNVVSCVSSRADKRLLHRIQMEASEPTPEDLSGLQRMLTRLVNSPATNQMDRDRIME